ncbi:hypothetical protein P6U16_26125 (plasmid) [Rhizobium sp. 32-5/1]|uniref:hypothetical protein n=1 Tax=Rhizobium sp. 32-5/1 TaxID=3019602 RepID=UPI00240E7D1B|nr:hypothetical protein [Rhizobium sp. 32-5/1]WEZ85531.1 hypothetical protein P6U16_26125 [Rhizobium sp. 32-5/1]
MRYEPEMTIIFDVLSKIVFVSFRGRDTMLGPFQSQQEGIKAGESHCRSLGWIDSDLRTPADEETAGALLTEIRKR